MDLPLRRYFELMMAYLRPLRPKMVLLGGLIIATMGLQLANPQIVRLFIDTAVSGPETSSLLNLSLLNLSLLFLATSLLLQGLGVAARYVSEDVGWRSTNQLRSDLARHCLHLDMSFHNQHTPGEMIERVDGDVANIAIFFSDFVLRILGNGLLIIGVLIALIWVDWRISVGMLIFCLINFYGLGKLRAVAVPYWKSALEAGADLFGFIEEQLAGTEDSKSSGAVPYVMRRLFQFHRVRVAKEIKGGLMSIRLIMAWIGMVTIGRVLSIVAGYLLFRAGSITIGTAYLIISYTNAIFQPLRQITNQFEQMQRAAAGIERVELLTREQTRITVPVKTAVLPPTPLSVTFQHVTFAYHDKEPTLKNIDFHLPAGRVLGLLGRTGSGKTTITRLLFRLYDPQVGAVILGDGIDLRTVALTDLRQRVGIVTQDVQLFRATVRDNLTFFDQRIADDRIVAVLTDLGLGDWLANLPDGLDTLMQSEGSSLSAGEAQLLAFTRVFLKDPGLVILDEASSRLDPATEQLIEQAIDKLLRDRTGIIVAHRLGTVARADEIMVLENGRILEHAPYDTLAHDPHSHFYALLQTGLDSDQSWTPSITQHAPGGDQ